jgi:hypothetical protein
MGQMHKAEKQHKEAMQLIDDLLVDMGIFDPLPKT